MQSCTQSVINWKLRSWWRTRLKKYVFTFFLNRSINSVAQQSDLSPRRWGTVWWVQPSSEWVRQTNIQTDCSTALRLPPLYGRSIKHVPIYVVSVCITTGTFLTPVTCAAERWSVLAMWSRSAGVRYFWRPKRRSSSPSCWLLNAVRVLRRFRHDRKHLAPSSATSWWWWWRRCWWYSDWAPDDCGDDDWRSSWTFALLSPTDSDRQSNNRILIRVIFIFCYLFSVCFVHLLVYVCLFVSISTMYGE